MAGHVGQAAQGFLGRPVAGGVRGELEVTHGSGEVDDARGQGAGANVEAQPGRPGPGQAQADPGTSAVAGAGRSGFDDQAGGEQLVDDPRDGRPGQAGAGGQLAAGDRRLPGVDDLLEGQDQVVGAQSVLPDRGVRGGRDAVHRAGHEARSAAYAAARSVPTGPSAITVTTCRARVAPGSSSSGRSQASADPMPR